jgi:hypothetical protein
MLVTFDRILLIGEVSITSAKKVREAGCGADRHFKSCFKGGLYFTRGARFLPRKSFINAWCNHRDFVVRGRAAASTPLTLRMAEIAPKKPNLRRFSVALPLLDRDGFQR